MVRKKSRKGSSPKPAVTARKPTLWEGTKIKKLHQRAVREADTTQFGLRMKAVSAKIGPLMSARGAFEYVRGVRSKLAAQFVREIFRIFQEHQLSNEMAKTYLYALRERRRKK